PYCPTPYRFVYTMQNLYNFKTALRTGNVCMKRLQSIGIVAGMLIAGSYLIPRSIMASQVIPVSLTLIFGFLIAWRLLYYKLQKTANFKSRIVILGTSKEARKIAEALQGHHHLDYEFKGFIDNVHDKPNLGMLHPHILGHCEQLQEIVEREGIDKIVIALS